MCLQAKEDTSAKRAELIDDIMCDSRVRVVADTQLKTLEKLASCLTKQGQWF